MRLASFLFVRFVPTFLLLLLLTPLVHAVPPVTGANSSTPRPRQVRFDVQITRIPSGPVPAPDTSKEPPAKPNAVPTPVPLPDGPVVVGSPIVTTLDRSTASVAVTGGTTSYNLALSPTVENADNAVQVLWNLRINGKDFPGGASSFTMTGAMRVIAGTDTPLAEMTLTDPKTSQALTFRVRVRVSVDDIASSSTPSGVPVGGATP